MPVSPLAEWCLIKYTTKEGRWCWYSVTVAAHISFYHETSFPKIVCWTPIPKSAKPVGQEGTKNVEFKLQPEDVEKRFEAVQNIIYSSKIYIYRSQKIVHSTFGCSVGESLGASATSGLLRTIAQAAASLRPFSTSTQNKMTTNEQRHRAKRKGNPIQLLPDASMMAWITSGPIRDDATVDNPNSPKNYTIVWKSTRW